VGAPLRTVVLFEILSRGPSARRATLSWPLVRKGLKGQRRLREWAKCSGVSIRELDEIAGMLLEHGVCRPDGTVDPEAERLCEVFVADALRRMKGAPRGPRPR
jgi:hypothetical protein